MADAHKPLLEEALQRNGGEWGSQELNALLDALPNAQSLPSKCSTALGAYFSERAAVNI
jgi:hypothetical protein